VEEVLAMVYYDYSGGINKTKQQTVEGGTDGACLHKQWGSAGFGLAVSGGSWWWTACLRLSLDGPIH
jgi:hypothetical protein